MRIFHIISRLDIGGAERVALNIASTSSTDMEMHVVEVIRSRSKVANSLLAECREKGIKVHRFVFPDWSFHYVPQKVAAWLFPLWFVWVYLRHKPDVMHCHTEMPDLAVFSFCRMFPWWGQRVRVVRTIHNNVLWSGMNRTGRWIERFMQERKANVAISLSVRDSYEKAYGTFPKGEERREKREKRKGSVIPLIYNGVERDKKGEKRAERREGEAFRVLFAGRWERQKGISALTDIIQMANEARWHFTLVGSGRLEEDVRKAAEGKENVCVKASIPQLASHLAEYDFVLMPSEFEGLPLLSIEAGMAAVPVLANRASGLTETLPEDWPLMVTGNDRGEWKALLERIEQGMNTASLGVALQRFASECFSLETMQRAYEDLYRRS